MARDAPCQRCDEPFDWSRDACPHCGWDKAAWVADGRYGLQLAHAT